MNNKVHLILYIAFICFIGACASTQNTENTDDRISHKKQLFTNHDLNISQISAQSILSYHSSTSINKILPAKSHNEILTKIDSAKFKEFLLGLSFRERLLWNDNYKDKIFNLKEMDNFFPFLVYSFPKVKNDSVLLFIQRFDPDQALLTREYRTTYFLWANDEYLFLLFTEIQEPLVSEDTYFKDTRKRWDQVPLMKKRNLSNNISIVKQDSFEYMSIDGYPKEMWIKIPLSAITSTEIKDELDDIEIPIEVNLTVPTAPDENPVKEDSSEENSEKSSEKSSIESSVEKTPASENIDKDSPVKEVPSGTN